MKIIAFFNNKGGVGKTTLVYHLAWMLSELDKTVVVADLDPQANLSSMFLSNDTLVQKIENKNSIIEALSPRMKSIADIKEAHLEHIYNSNIHLIIGDLILSTFEDKLSRAWTDCLNRDEGAFLSTTAFYRMLQKAAKNVKADIVLIDVGPNLGAINRTALIAADEIIVPVAADLFSIQGMSNLGRTLKNWREEWEDIKKRKPTDLDIELPEGKANTLGYILSQHGVRASRPVQAYLKWAKRIPIVFRKDVLGLDIDESQEIKIEGDEYSLGLLRHYQSLMPMAMEANKPIFKLKPGDGANGAHFNAARKVYYDFEEIAKTILTKLGI